MNNDWMYAPGTGFDLASLSLFSPLMPTAYTVPHHTLRLLYAISSQAQIRFGSEEEILLGNRMLLLAQDTPYMAISNNSASMLGQLDIVLRKAEGRLMLPQRLYRFNTDYADLCACSSPVLPFQDSSGLIKCLTSVLQLRIGSLGPSSALVELTLATILMAVGDALYDTDNVSVAHTQHVQHALKFIHDHYMEPIVTEDVAQEVHLHPNYLHRIFATEMGRSIGEYLTSWRMEKARSLLIGSQTQVVAIARMCGIPNHQHFTKTFRKTYGLSPIGFRKKYDITCNYQSARSQYGVTYYSGPDVSAHGEASNLSFFDAKHREQNYIPVIKAYYSRADMEESTKDTTDHAHPLYEIMYVQEGMITVETEDTAINVGRRQYIWLDASIHHKLTLHPDMASSVVNIEFAMCPADNAVPSSKLLYSLDEAYAAMMNQPVHWLMLTDTQDLIGALLRQIVLMADSSHRHKDLLCSCMSQQCLLIMSAQRQASTWLGQRSFSGDPLMERVAAKVEELYAQPLTVDELATYCDITAAHLQQLLQRCTGLTVHAYVQNVRLEKSKAFLRSGLTVLETASRVGFSSQQYYAQLFKRYNNLSPTVYRAQFHAKSNE